MESFLKKIFKYAFFSLILSNVIAFASLSSIKNSDIFKPSYILRHFSKNQRNFDYVVLGPSTGLRGTDTRIIDSVFHKKGFNLSMDDISYGGQYLMLEHFIKNGFKTKSCILILIPERINTTNENFYNNEFYFLPFINESPIYKYFAEKETGAKKIRAYTKYLPILGVSYYNQQLFFSSLISFVKPHYRHHFDEFGNEINPFPNEPNIHKELKKDTLLFKNNDVKKIEALCRKKNIKLIYYYSPQYHETIDKTKAINNRIIIDNNFTFNKKLFQDKYHLNIEGRRIATLALCDSLKIRKLFH